MRIGIDARFFGHLGKGLGRYTQKLIENLEKIDDRNEYFIFLRKENFDDYVPQSKNFTKVMADYRWYSLAEQLGMPRLLNRYCLDLVHFPHFNVPIFYRKRFLVTIHDLIIMHFPSERGTRLGRLTFWLKYLAYRYVISHAVSRADTIITVSRFTQNDLIERYPSSSSKIFVTYEACEDFCYLSRTEVLEKYGIIKPYLLYVGNAYPHKNLERLLLAFQKVRANRASLRLVLVGRSDYFYNRLKRWSEENGIEGVVFSGFVPDSELDSLYRNASLYVFPSRYEGFGLPPLEAMAKGLPVIASDQECLREILGKAADYFDPVKVGDMARMIRAVLSDDIRCRNLVSEGYRQIAKYSWKRMAETTLQIYNR